jgi:ribonuclease P/MRP protein subunit POP5
MRFKRRYFCVQIIFQDESIKKEINKLKHNQFSETIHSSIEKFYGDFGMAVMIPSFSVIYFNSSTNIAILRTARDTQKKFHSLPTFIQKIGELKVCLKTIHVSGSIKKSKKFLIDYCNQKLLSLCNQNSSECLDIKSLINICQNNHNVFNVK